jgi:hypothetical protein
MVEIMNSFVKSVLNKKNEDRKFEQLTSNENLAKIAVDKETGKKRPILFWAGSKELSHGNKGIYYVSGNVPKVPCKVCGHLVQLYFHIHELG